MTAAEKRALAAAKAASPFTYRDAVVFAPTEAISTFEEAIVGHTVQVFNRKDATKRQVIRLTNKANGQNFDLILSRGLTNELAEGTTSINSMGDCEIHERETENADGTVSTWYILQRPAGTSVPVLDGDKLAAKSTEYVSKQTFSLQGVDLTDLVA